MFHFKNAGIEIMNREIGGELFLHENKFNLNTKKYKAKNHNFSKVMLHYDE